MMNKNFEVFLNCEDPKTVEKYMDLYPALDGVTTNPVMISRLGRKDYFSILRELRSVIGNRKLFSQVTSKNPDEIVEEAKRIHQAGGENTIVKVPVVEFGMKAIYQLNEIGIRTCGTLVCSTIQGMMALEAGATYVVPFHFHMQDGGLDPIAVTKELVEYTRTAKKGRILGAAHRTPQELGGCIGCGVHACTLNPDFITGGMNNEVTVKTLEEFLGGWENVFGKGTKILDLEQ